MADQLEEIAKEEMEHSEELAERIIQLGGEPISDWDEITKRPITQKSIYQDRSDYEGILKAVHVADRAL